MAPISWSNLPEELLELIIKRLGDPFDLLQSRDVCHSWRSVVDQVYPELYPMLPPLLFISSEGNSMETPSGLFSVFRSKHRPCRIPKLRTLGGGTCANVVYSSRGWLVLLGAAPVLPALSFYLFNPVTRMNIPLPTLENCGSWKQVKFIISCNPSNPSCIVLALYMGKSNLAFCKPGDELWRPIASRVKTYEDIIYYKDQFYAVDTNGTIVHINLGSHPHPHANNILEWPQGRGYSRRYLVESSSGNLLTVVRHLERDGHLYRTRMFEVFKLDWRKGKWSTVTSLDDQAIFLARNGSICIRARDSADCQRNCIYFTNDSRDNYINWSSSNDFGIFDLRNQIINGASNTSPGHDTLCHRWLKPDI